MSAEKLPGGGWRCRWRDARGNPRSKGSKRWTKKQALAYERKMLDLRDKGVSAGDMTVAELADAWLAASRHLAESSRTTYRRELDHDILPVLGHLRVAKLDALAIDAYLAKLAGAGRAATTQRRHLLSIISPMCTYARSRGLIAASPTADVRAPRLDAKEKRFLSMPELRQLASAFPERYQRLILFTGIMGPRWGEVWRMVPADVQGFEVIIRGTKSASSLRRVTMPAFVQLMMVEQQEYWATPASMWPSNLGKAPHANYWRQKVWTPALERSGVGHLRFHDLRHTAAALAIDSGANPLLVQKRLGHASISVTLGIYGHLFPSADAPVADALDDAWNQGDDNVPS